MKLTALLATFLAVLALAQSDNEHGVRTGPIQTAYFIKPVEVSRTVDASDPTGRQLLAAEHEARASAGAAPVKLILTGRSVVTGKETHGESILAPPRLCGLYDHN